MSEQTLNDQLVQSMLDKCKHFTGIQNQKCGAGVVYQDVRVEHEPVPYKDRWGKEYTSTVSSPCMAKYNYCGAMCAKREVLSEAEARQKAGEREASIKLTTEAMARCSQDANGRRGIAGVVECPKCKGNLHYTVAAINGHLWGKCETQDCLAWMM